MTIGPKAAKALKFAVAAHDGQVRKESGLPFVFHPIEAASYLYREVDDVTEDDLCAMLLHDTLEDCPQVTHQQLTELFGSPVADMVLELTNPSKKFPNSSRADRKKMDREHIAGLPVKAKTKKAVDRICNLTDFHHQCSDPKFAVKYAEESRLLAQEALGGIPWKLLFRLQFLILEIKHKYG